MATYVGILFCINILFGLLFISTWIILYFIFKYSSLSSLLAALSIPASSSSINQSNDEGRGAIVFTKYYLAVAHNDLNLSNGVDFKVDGNSKISSFMNTGLNVFFKNADRKLLSDQMSNGDNLLILFDDDFFLLRLSLSS